MMIPYIHVPDQIPEVPFYSQFKDIQMPEWQKVGCGVASLAMIIDYYSTAKISVDTVLGQATSTGAYDTVDGWIYKGLISVAKEYGLVGSTHDLRTSDKSTALSQLKKYAAEGPVIASIYYKFDPKSTIPHLVVVDGIKDDVVYYNDPAAKTGEKKISVADFQKGWKKKFIVMRPSISANTFSFAAWRADANS